MDLFHSILIPSGVVKMQTHAEPAAFLVWDNLTKKLDVPSAWGKPREDQLQGSPLDQIIEIAGRTCYDSAGKGRSSVDYHKHIVEVDHTSVLEHAVLTFESLPLSIVEMAGFAMSFFNLPGVWIRVAEKDPQNTSVRVTMNLRTIRELRKNKFGTIFGAKDTAFVPLVQRICHVARAEAPLALFDFDPDLDGGDLSKLINFAVVPETDNEVWASFYAIGISRGLSHEWVRHGDWTAISQESTRYVDSAQSRWVMHPLMKALMDKSESFTSTVQDAIRDARSMYEMSVDFGMRELQNRGIDGTNARKQARGAARGMLGNALETAIFFSASIAQWKWMLLKRASDAADAEIRVLFGDQIFPQLQARFPDRFEGWSTKPATDGFGTVVVPPDDVVWR